jgi:hypothetical protein
VSSLKKFNQTFPPDERIFGKQITWVPIDKTTNTSGRKVADVTEVLRNDQILLEK